MREKNKINIITVFGTRPDAIKMAPVCHALEADPAFNSKILVTAQHRHMLDQVLEIFKLHSNFDLNIMEESQTLFHITRETLHKMEKILLQEKPDLVLVHGDTTTAFAAALSAFYLHIPVGHVEAGLRSFDMDNPYPEEANRVLTDAITTLHFAPTHVAAQNLAAHKARHAHIFITGNTVIDALLSVVKRPYNLNRLPININPKEFLYGRKLILMTAHRRENFGEPIKQICSAVKAIAREFPDVHIVYPVHLNPCIKKPVYRYLNSQKNISLIPPVDYEAFAQLIKLSYFVVTDSGGIQEEAPSLGKPVLVLRKVTERPEAVKAGTVRIIGTNEQAVYTSIKTLLTNRRQYIKMSKAINPYGDGKASMRILQAIKCNV
ncbi:MAG: UDP-N-acetylglucosamine 2-epimerase (non-hydrolyzing) [bacterium]